MYAYKTEYLKRENEPKKYNKKVTELDYET